MNSPGPTLDIRPPFCGGKQPLLLLALAFSCGIVAARFVWHPAMDWALASLLLMALAAFAALCRPTFGFATALLSVAMLGGLAYSTRLVSVVAFPRAATEGECHVVAHVVRDGVLQQGMFGGQQQSIDLATESIDLPEGTKFTKPLGLRLSIYARKSDYEDEEQKDAGTLPMPLLRYGQRVQLMAKLHEPRNYGNPGAWDYRGYLQGQGIALLGSARVSSVELLPGFGGHKWTALQHHARAAVIRKIHELWAGDEASLFDAVVIGERSQLGHDVKTNFQSTGK